MALDVLHEAGLQTGPEAALGTRKALVTDVDATYVDVEIAARRSFVVAVRTLEHARLLVDLAVVQQETVNVLHVLYIHDDAQGEWQLILHKYLIDPTYQMNF